MEAYFELQNQFKDKQEKYIYYIIALCVASIGFSVYRTGEQELSWQHIPLGIAILFWAISIFSGLNFIKITLSTIYGNIHLLQIRNGENAEVGKNALKIEAACVGIEKAIEKKGNKAKHYFLALDYCFYTGIISFIIWHIIMMHLNNCK